MTQLKRLASLAAALAGLAVGATHARAQDEFTADAAHLVTALKLQPGQTVADIGAGRGQLAAALAREVGPSGRVYATELSDDRLRDLRALAESTTNVSVVEAKTSEHEPARALLRRARPASSLPPFQRPEADERQPPRVA